jgi:hypothetical protein
MLIQDSSIRMTLRMTSWSYGKVVKLLVEIKCSSKAELFEVKRQTDGGGLLLSMFLCIALKGVVK